MVSAGRGPCPLNLHNVLGAQESLASRGRCSAPAVRRQLEGAGFRDRPAPTHLRPHAAQEEQDFWSLLTEHLEMQETLANAGVPSLGCHRWGTIAGVPSLECGAQLRCHRWGAGAQLGCHRWGSITGVPSLGCRCTAGVPAHGRSGRVPGIELGLGSTGDAPAGPTRTPHSLLRAAPMAAGWGASPSRPSPCGEGQGTQQGLLSGLLRGMWAEVLSAGTPEPRDNLRAPAATTWRNFPEGSQQQEHLRVRGQGVADRQTDVTRAPGRSQDSRQLCKHVVSALLGKRQRQTHSPSREMSEGILGIEQTATPRTCTLQRVTPPTPEIPTSSSPMSHCQELWPLIGGTVLDDLVGPTRSQRAWPVTERQDDRSQTGIWKLFIAAFEEGGGARDCGGRCWRLERRGGRSHPQASGRIPPSTENSPPACGSRSGLPTSRTIRQ